MTDADVIAFAGLSSGLDDDAIRCRHDGCSNRRTVINAVMRPEAVKDRMEAAAGEMRCDARELQRCAEELFAQRRSGTRVVARMTVRHLMAIRLEGRTFVREACGENRAVADEIA